MKFQVFKTHLLKTIKWYEEELARIYGPMALTPAMGVRMSRYFESMVEVQRAKEPTTSWQIPLELKFSSNGEFKVELADPDNVLYLDDLSNNKP